MKGISRSISSKVFIKPISPIELLDLMTKPSVGGKKVVFVMNKTIWG
jgi:hypothetical protein